MLTAARGTGSRAALATVLRRGWPMVKAAYTPLVVLLVIVITGNLRVAVFTALGLATVLLGGLGVLCCPPRGPQSFCPR